MNKVVVLRLSCPPNGNLYQVTAEIGNEGQASDIEVQGWLPKPPEKFLQILDDWKIAFGKLDFPKRLKVRKISVNPPVKGYLNTSSSSHLNKSDISWDEVCEKNAQRLKLEMNLWLNSSGFIQIRRTLNQYLNFDCNVQIIVCTNEDIVCKLPWNCWDILENFRRAEVCFNLANESHLNIASRQENRLEGLKLLIVLGDNEGLDLEKDKWILDKQFSETTDVFSKPLIQPSKVEFVKFLESGTWNILFFSGHSETLDDEGIIYLKNGESVYLSELDSSFKKAISKGLKLAIFNSCDGIGLARSLQRLQIPQIIVMSEPIPDKVAHDFLSAYINALQSLHSDSPLYLAARHARNALKSSIVCADWLPIVFQNHKVPSPVRGFIEKSRPIISNAKNQQLASSSIEIAPRFHFEEPIYTRKEIHKVIVIDPIGETAIGKIQYMGALWKAKMLPLKEHGLENLNDTTLIFPGDEVSVVAREGNIYFVLPKDLAELDSFNKLKLKFKRERRAKKRDVFIPFILLLIIFCSFFSLILYTSKNGSSIPESGDFRGRQDIHSSRQQCSA